MHTATLWIDPTPRYLTPENTGILQVHGSNKRRLTASSKSLPASSRRESSFANVLRPATPCSAAATPHDAASITKHRSIRDLRDPIAPPLDTLLDLYFFLSEVNQVEDVAWVSCKAIILKSKVWP